MTDNGVLVAGTIEEPKPSLFARFKKQSNKEKKLRNDKTPSKEKKTKKPKKPKKEKHPLTGNQKNKSVDEDSVKAAAPSPLMSLFHTGEKKKPRSEYQSEIDQLTDELKQTKQLLAAAQERNALVQEKLDRLKRWASNPPL